jgi:hypothetical protein
VLSLLMMMTVVVIVGGWKNEGGRKGEEMGVEGGHRPTE